jgi:glutathione synthase/RimK-type ligase-like ATP-grasp enzyme
MHRLGLVTYRGLPDLSRDDQLVLAPLAQRGIRTDAVAWDDTAVAWDSYDAYVIRSTWNYHTALGAFTAWIDRVESLGIPVWNPPKTLRWNARKTYLRDLEALGIDVVPTWWVDRNSRRTLAEMLRDAKWSEAVIKPAVSASAYETWRVSADDVNPEAESRFRRLTALGPVMVQPFLTELARDGEWSLMFIGREYSHAVLKRPRAGDFRVQYEHGGTAEARTPPAHVVSTASDILRRVRGPLLYARVDGVELDGRFILVELELLEPSLFLGADADAAERFADAICRVLGEGPKHGL